MSNITFKYLFVTFLRFFALLCLYTSCNAPSDLVWSQAWGSTVMRFTKGPHECKCWTKKHASSSLWAIQISKKNWNRDRGAKTILSKKCSRVKSREIDVYPILPNFRGKSGSIKIPQNINFPRFLASNVGDWLSLLLDLDLTSGSGLKMLPDPILTWPDFCHDCIPLEISCPMLVTRVQ